MKIYEIGTGYTSIPAQMGAATEIVVEELTRSFKKEKYDVHIIDIKSVNRKENDLPIIEVNVPRIFLKTDVSLGVMHKLKRVIYSVNLAFKLKKIISSSSEKIVLHFHNQYNMFFFLKLVSKQMRKKCHVVYTNHSGIWSLEWGKISNIIKKRYFQEVFCMKNADQIFLLNQDTKRNVIKYLKIEESRICMIHNGVNTQIYRPLKRNEKEKIKEKYGFSGKKIILQVGSVYENKGQLKVIQFLKDIFKLNKDIIYVYVGGIVSKEYYQEIKQYIKENKLEERIHYLGIVHPGKELNEIYNIAQATIIASSFEGFVMVAIESMSAGIPVLVDSNFFLKFGEGEIRYNSEDISDIIQNKLINDEIYNEYCKNSRETATTQYSWDKIADDYLKFWKNYLKTNENE